MDHAHTTLATVTASLGALATSDELQSLILALLAIAVREVVYWWTHRRKTPTLTAVPPPDDGGNG